ncbi:YciI family protein [Phytomonospora sp. NPDC050363]|uniref:YciI family protein n=1 Tax=Phytomonospora sp. NPDC050363 TaxID=3155642 RepID=UPI003402387B
MRYMLLICGTEPEGPPPDRPLDEETLAWAQDLKTEGVRVFGSRLRHTSTASTVRVRGDDALVSDGPFAETKEQILGFDIIECADLDEALAVAASHPAARTGTIEVRPVWPTPI